MKKLAKSICKNLFGFLRVLAALFILVPFMFPVLTIFIVWVSCLTLPVFLIPYMLYSNAVNGTPIDWSDLLMLSIMWGVSFLLFYSFIEDD